jgi:hypothetical protein
VNNIPPLTEQETKLLRAVRLGIACGLAPSLTAAAGQMTEGAMGKLLVAAFLEFAAVTFVQLKGATDEVWNQMTSTALAAVRADPPQQQENPDERTRHSSH